MGVKLVLGSSMGLLTTCSNWLLLLYKAYYYTPSNRIVPENKNSVTSVFSISEYFPNIITKCSVYQSIWMKLKTITVTIISNQWVQAQEVLLRYESTLKLAC